MAPLFRQATDAPQYRQSERLEGRGEGVSRSHIDQAD